MYQSSVSQLSEYPSIEKISDTDTSPLMKYPCYIGDMQKNWMIYFGYLDLHVLKRLINENSCILNVRCSCIK